MAQKTGFLKDRQTNTILPITNAVLVRTTTSNVQEEINQIKEEIRYVSLFKGVYETESALLIAYPNGVIYDDGIWAILMSTDTVWVYDNDTTTWLDTGSVISSVTSVNYKEPDETGNILLVGGDINSTVNNTITSAEEEKTITQHLQQLYDYLDTEITNRETAINDLEDEMFLLVGKQNEVDAEGTLAGNILTFETNQNYNLQNNTEYEFDFSFLASGTLNETIQIKLFNDTQEIKLITPYNFNNDNLATIKDLNQIYNSYNNDTGFRWLFKAIINISANNVYTALIDMDNLEDYYNKSETDTLLNSKANITDIPTETSDLINNGDGTSPFATQNYVEINGGKIDKINVNNVEQEIVDKEVNIDVPTTTNELTNDSGFITNQVSDLTNYYSKLTTDNLLNGKADIEDIPTQTSELTNNSGFITKSVGNLDNYYDKTTSDTLLSAKANTSSVPVNISQLNNDSGFITNTVNNLTNYYLKTQTYTQAEVNNLISAISTLNVQIVQTLPTQDISTTTIYMIAKTNPTTGDYYDEYMYINNSWEMIGTTQIDLTNYYTKTEINTLLSNKANSADLNNYVTLNTEQIISGTKTFDTLYATMIMGDNGSILDMNEGSFSTLGANTFLLNGSNLQTLLNAKANSSAIPTALSQLSTDSTHRVVTDSQITSWNNKLSTAPVTSVNGETGAVTLNASDVGALSNSGGTLAGQLLFSTGTTQANTKGIKWSAINSKNPYIGYALDQTDGTFILGSLLGTNFASGLAIGGGSGNLLWKGLAVATTNQFANYYTKAQTDALIPNEWYGTQAQYDAITTKSSTTTYYIYEE